MAIPNSEREVELRVDAAAADSADLEPIQFRRTAKRVAGLEHHLKERVLLEIPSAVADLDQPLEGQLLMGICTEGRFPYPGQQFLEIGCPERSVLRTRRVEETANQAFELDIAAAQIGVPITIYFLSAIPCEQGLERRHRVMNRLPPPGPQSALSSSVSLRGSARVAFAARPSQEPRGGALGWKLQARGGTQETLSPIGELSFELLGLRLAPLPHGVVGILKW